MGLLPNTTGMVKVAVETSNGIRAYKDIVVYLKLGNEQKDETIKQLVFNK